MPAMVDIKSLHESSRKVQYFDSIALATYQAVESMSFVLGCRCFESLYSVQ